MVIKLVWSKRADQGFARIIKYLEDEYTDKEVQNFVRETKHFFEILKQNPRILEPSRLQKDLYRGPINRLTILTYRYKPRQKLIVLINIRDARKKPIK